MNPSAVWPACAVGCGRASERIDVVGPYCRDTACQHQYQYDAAAYYATPMHQRTHYLRRTKQMTPSSDPSDAVFVGDDTDLTECCIAAVETSDLGIVLGYGPDHTSALWAAVNRAFEARQAEHERSL